MGSYIHGLEPQGQWPTTRFIYIEIVAGTSILLGVIWVIPFDGGFFHWIVDLLLAFAWVVAFGLLFDYAKSETCHGSFLHVRDTTQSKDCKWWNVAETFSFLSACVWLTSGLL